MTDLYPDTVLVLRPTSSTDRSGSVVLDYRDLEPARSWREVRVRPAMQLEREAADRTLTVSEWLVSSRPGTGDFDIVSTDVVELPTGERARVIGDPARPTDPVRGGLHHIQVLVRKA